MEPSKSRHDSVRQPNRAWAHFIMDRPEVANAFDIETAVALEKALVDAKKSGAIAFIISSKNPRVFCGGGDLRSYSKMKTKIQGVKVNARIRKILESFKRSPLFVIAAVEGSVIGGGCELILACDIVITGINGRFAFRQVHQALTPGWGGTKKLLKRVRPSIALDWLSSGRAIDTSEALRTGLVDIVVTSGCAVRAAEEWADERRHLDQNYVLKMKALLAKGGLGEEKVFDSLWFSEDHRAILNLLKQGKGI